MLLFHVCCTVYLLYTYMWDYNRIIGSVLFLSFIRILSGSLASSRYTSKLLEEQLVFWERAWLLSWEIHGKKIFMQYYYKLLQLVVVWHLLWECAIYFLCSRFDNMVVCLWYLRIVVIKSLSIFSTTLELQHFNHPLYHHSIVVHTPPVPDAFFMGQILILTSSLSLSSSIVWNVCATQHNFIGQITFFKEYFKFMPLCPCSLFFSLQLNCLHKKAWQGSQNFFVRLKSS